MKTQLITQYDVKTEGAHLYGTLEHGATSLCGQAKKDRRQPSFVISSTLFWDRTKGACKACFEKANAPAEAKEVALDR